jgi:hypothetical protein
LSQAETRLRDRIRPLLDALGGRLRLAPAMAGMRGAEPTPRTVSIKRFIEAYRKGTGSSALDGFLASMLLIAIMAVGISAHVGPSGITAGLKRHRAASQRVVPPDVVPEVEPIEFQAMTADEARAFNASIPFSTDRNPAARPFRFAGGTEDRLRALDCLAAAVLYEAGDDPEGQRAVAQVVLNRVRHPAFPKTVCGVVFQGSERRTGCQFTFTCDGALIRNYAQPFWDRARLIADAALAGSVFKPVGQATHYHTDWVVPYWSSSLDKIVEIKTHLFFRWTGWWGTPPAFRFEATGLEPHVTQLALRFPEHGTADLNPMVAGTEPLPGGAPSTISNVAMKPSSDNPNAFVVLLAAQNAANFAEIAAFTCGSRPTCKFMGWTDPAKLPTDNSSKLAPAQLASLSFSYLRDRSLNLERALWDCSQFKRTDGQCLWSKSPPPDVKAGAPVATPSESPTKPLDGVRFKNEPAPAAKP